MLVDITKSHSIAYVIHMKQGHTVKYIWKYANVNFQFLLILEYAVDAFWFIWRSNLQ